MARQVIDIGTAANDGTGDPLRTAFDKINSMTLELYNTQPLNVDDVGYDVWLIAGQSNAAQRAAIDEYVDIADPRVFQYGNYSTDADTFEKIVSGGDPLKMPDSLSVDRTGYSSWFGRSMALMTPKNRLILLVPCAQGATTLVSGTPSWGDGGTRRTNAIAQTNSAIAAAQLIHPDSRFKGVIWGQGETDGDNSVSEANYTNALYDLITDFRASITGATDSLFVICGMVPEAIATRAGYDAIDAAHQAIGSAVPKCVYVPGESGYSSDDLHYNVHPGVRVMGAKLARYTLLAEQNEGTLVAPENTAVPVISGTETQGQTLSATTGAWSNDPTGYAYQWKRNTVNISGATNSNYLLTADDVGSTITVTVTASNLAGSATATSSATGEIQAAPSSSIYDFEADTVGSPPANTTTLVGVFEVTDTGATGITSKYMRSTTASAQSAVDVIELDNLVPASINQVVTWRRGVGAQNNARDGFLLRPQAGTTNDDYPGIKHGYYAQISGSNASLRLYKFTQSVISTLRTFAFNPSTATYYRASVVGDGTPGNEVVFDLEYSVDGETWNSVGAYTDSSSPFTTTSGPIQYITGWTGTPANAYVDDIELT